VQAGGHVLLLGSPLAHVTLLHLAENLARLPHKRQVRYSLPVLRQERPVRETFTDLDTSRGVVDFPGEDYFETITRACLETGAARDHPGTGIVSLAVIGDLFHGDRQVKLFSLMNSANFGRAAQITPGSRPARAAGPGRPWRPSPSGSWPGACIWSRRC